MRRLVLVAPLILAVTLPVQATTIHVPGDYSTIQAGVDAAVAGDTVLVSPGTFDDLFYPPGPDTTRCVVYMKSGITLRGSGQGVTTIDAQDSGRGIYCEAVTNARIESFTITHAFAEVFAAAIFCNNGASPSIYDCELTDNGDGGMIINDNSSPEVSYCEITNNVSKQGGGISIEDFCSPTFTHCNIIANAAPVAGGVFIRNLCEPVFEHCVIDNNFLDTDNGAGGGVALRFATLTMRNCEVNGNNSTGTGGGLDLRDEFTAVIESTYVQNNVTSGPEQGAGGGMYCETSTMLDLDYCVITGNSASGDLAYGGGIYLWFIFDASFTNCTIAGNSTIADTMGGGITCEDNITAPVIDKTIIASNGPGRSVHCRTTYDPVPVLTCSDVWGNQGGDWVDCIAGQGGAGGNFSLDPLFCGPEAGDFHLDAASPCLNAPGCGLVGALGEGCDGFRTSVGDGDLAGPREGTVWHYATPNPFGPATKIHFSIDHPQSVSLAIYGVSGRRVRLLEERTLLAGEHEVVWDARDDAGREVPSGVYFYRLGGSASPRTGRLVLTR